MGKETLSDKMFVVWRKDVFYKKDVKEKIQNVERRLKEKIIDFDKFSGEGYQEIGRFLGDEIDKIFNEEIGEGILK